jgi:hypothetical protein
LPRISEFASASEFRGRGVEPPKSPRYATGADHFTSLEGDWYPLNSSVIEPQSKSERFGEENHFFDFPEYEPKIFWSVAYLIYHQHNLRSSLSRIIYGIFNPLTPNDL